MIGRKNERKGEEKGWDDEDEDEVDDEMDADQMKHRRWWDWTDAAIELAVPDGGLNWMQWRQ